MKDCSWLQITYLRSNSSGALTRPRVRCRSERNKLWILQVSYDSRRSDDVSRFSALLYSVYSLNIHGVVLTYGRDFDLFVNLHPIPTPSNMSDKQLKEWQFNPDNPTRACSSSHWTTCKLHAQRSLCVSAAIIIREFGAVHSSSPFKSPLHDFSRQNYIASETFLQLSQLKPYVAYCFNGLFQISTACVRRNN